MHLYFPHGRFCFIMPAAFRQLNLPDAIAAERSISGDFEGKVMCPHRRATLPSIVIRRKRYSFPLITRDEGAVVGEVR